MTAVATEPVVHAEVVSIPLALIDRDPKQPRFAENVDTDLAASFKAHGWFESEPLEIRPHPEDPERFQLVDGERRFAGAKAAGLKDALCVLTFEADGVSEADRLMRQLQHNAGKPLTPVEQALAFKRIIDDRRGATNGKGDKKYGPVQLARDLGMPKSTITDRLAMTEIPAFWLPLIVNGPLQPSHVPILHRWRKVPEKFQRRALEQLEADYRWPRMSRSGHRASKGDRLYVGEFESLLEFYMHKFVRAVADVPGYKGPTERGAFKPGYGNGVKVYAMDPSQWQPIFRRAVAAKRKKKREVAGIGEGERLSSHESHMTPAQLKENRRRERERLREDAAEPAIFAAIAKAINAAPAEALGAKGPLGSILLEYVATDNDLLYDMEHTSEEDVQRAVPPGANDPAALVRHLAAYILASEFHDSYRNRLEKVGKQLGVDVKKIIKATPIPTEQRPDPATTDPGEQGDGLLSVNAADEDEDDG